MCKQKWNNALLKERWIGFFLRALAEQAQANAEKARQILALYERLKSQILQLTHSQYAIPLLDRLFRQPVFPSSLLLQDKAMPSKPMVMALLRKLREAGILAVVREGSGRRAQILALGELVNMIQPSSRTSGPGWSRRMQTCGRPNTT